MDIETSAWLKHWEFKYLHDKKKTANTEKTYSHFLQTFQPRFFWVFFDAKFDNINFLKSSAFLSRLRSYTNIFFLT